MDYENRIEILIRLQKGKNLSFVQTGESAWESGSAFPLSARAVEGCFETMRIPGGWAARLRLKLQNSPAEENRNLDLERPISLKLRVAEPPQKITALYLFCDWWTRPAFVDSFSQVPKRTQVALLQYADRYACLVPAVGEQYKASLCPGGNDWFALEMTSGTGGQSSLDEPVFLLTEDQSIFGAVEKAFSYLAKEKGIRTRAERRLPEMFRYLGWCSWDAFRTDITEEKVRAKAKELSEKKVPVRWLLMDDGWLDVEDNQLRDFAPDRNKFPEGFSKMIADIKKEGDISWFGVWHALAGYWGGIHPDGALARKEAANLYRAVNGKILPSPEAGKGTAFYSDWYALLRGEGIDFAKVDVQSAVKNYTENSMPFPRAARGLQKALEGGASYLDGAVLNCMGMAMENLLARPSSALSRNSDDFFPEKEDSFTEHLLENAYNALYHGQVFHCDWDMFWTSHKDSAKHSLLRAISGGPVYVSDKIGETDPKVLEPLAYADGRLLMMDGPACPTADCVFSDPTRKGVLKLTNTADFGRKKAGGIAVYNLTGKRQEYCFSPDAVRGISPAGRYLVYDYFRKTASLCAGTTSISAPLEAGGFAWYQVVPFAGKAAFLGLAGKYAGFSAMESIYTTEQGLGGIVREQGAIRFAASEKPHKVRCNGFDVSHLLLPEREAPDLTVYTIDLPPERQRAVLELCWERP